VANLDQSIGIDETLDQSIGIDETYISVKIFYLALNCMSHSFGRFGAVCWR